MKKRIIIPVALIVVAIIVYFVTANATSENNDIFTKAQKGEFVITVTTTGELEAKNEKKIMGPRGMRAARIWETKINKLVDEGTVVEKGQFIAELDQSQLRDRLQEAQTQYTEAEAQYEQTELDTALTLREARDKLINLDYAVEEKKLILEQSQFEPPATIKQAEIDVDKAIRALKQAKENYVIQVKQSIARMKEVKADLSDERRELDFLKQLQSQFIITAPESGMVIYEREFNGQKKREGSNVSAWNPTVATLPDLTTMISKTFVNEVDIRKIEVGQDVKVGLDAFPEKKLTGKVVSVANVGEQKPNSDAKVFEVSIVVNESDTTLRPAMTTSNIVQASIIKNVVHVPLECIQSQGDSLAFVYQKNGIDILKKQVITGVANDNSIIIEQGLNEGDVVALSTIEGMEEEEVVLIEGKPAKNLANNN